MSPGLSAHSPDADSDMAKASVDIEVPPASVSSLEDVATAGGAPIEQVEFLTSDVSDQLSCFFAAD